MFGTVPETWFERELPILQAISEADVVGDNLDHAAKNAVPGLDEQVYRRTIQALHDARYIDARFLPGGGKLHGAHVVKLLERGRRETRQWPSEDLGEALLDVLERLIETEQDPDRKRQLTGLREKARELGVGMLGNILVMLGHAGIQGLGS